MIDLYPTRQIRMDELATRVQGGETFEVWSYDKALDTFVVQTVSHSWTKGTRPILEVELEDGRTLRCTPEHLLMTTNRGWVRAGDLTTEDDVMELDL
jgi:intein/homing endonuclease